MTKQELGRIRCRVSRADLLLEHIAKCDNLLEKLTNNKNIKLLEAGVSIDFNFANGCSIDGFYLDMSKEEKKKLANEINTAMMNVVNARKKQSIEQFERA